MARTALRKVDRGAAPVPAPALLGTLRGDAYHLGAEVGSGGECVIHAVARRPELLAKLYRRAPSRFDVEKLDALVRAATPDLLSVAAWPIDSLKNGAGAVVGFVMPRVLDGRPLYELYSPRSRAQHFPSADFRFLVHVAANIARLFAAVHQAGFIMGDVNHGNILVRSDGTVAAVDCDSFQVGDGARFPCPVGTELFLAPELAGQNLWTVRRTANHAGYGLAVLLFHLLFMGRHPFAGRFLGAGEMPIEKAIAECRFAYSSDARRTKMAPPPFTPPLAVAGSVTAELFERAFHPNGRTGGRPTAEDWVKALEPLQGSLAVCGAAQWHQYASSLGSCPWCAIERGSKAKLFGGVVRIAPAAVADVQTLWARYLQIADPGPPRPLPRSDRAHSCHAHARGSQAPYQLLPPELRRRRPVFLAERSGPLAFACHSCTAACHTCSARFNASSAWARCASVTHGHWRSTQIANRAMTTIATTAMGFATTTLPKLPSPAPERRNMV